MENELLSYPQGFSEFAQKLTFIPEGEREDFATLFLFMLLTEDM